MSFNLIFQEFHIEPGTQKELKEASEKSKYLVQSIWYHLHIVFEGEHLIFSLTAYLVLF